MRTTHLPDNVKSTTFWRHVARVGDGKTVFLLNVAVCLAKQGHRVGFVSNEVQTVADRLTALKDKSVVVFDHNVWERLLPKSARAALADGAATLWLQLGDAVDVQLFERLDVLIVDPIGFGHCSLSGENAHIMMRRQLAALRHIARIHGNLAVIVSQQLPRSQSIKSAIDKAAAARLEGDDILSFGEVFRPDDTDNMLCLRVQHVPGAGRPLPEPQTFRIAADLRLHFVASQRTV